MKPIDMLVIGTVQEYQRLRTDIDQNLGVVFASVTNVPCSRHQRFVNQDKPVRNLDFISRAIIKYQPGRAIFLSPYRGMAKDVLQLSKQGVDVRLCGPLPVRSQEIQLPITAIYQSDANVMGLLEASRDADFGEPVYLRMISSPEVGKWRKWWCVFQSCQLAEKILNARLQRIYVASVGTKTNLHINITLMTETNSMAHLLVANDASMLHGDLFLVGTGGTLTDNSLLNHPGIYSRSDFRILPRPGEQRLDALWNKDALIRLTNKERAFYDRVLQAIGDSAKNRKGICLNYPII